jgi:adenylate cyclase
MECPRCQRQNPQENAFCGGCGAPLARRCPACGRESPPENAFCGSCGERIEAPSAPAALSGPDRSPRDYTPRHLADKILQSRSALEGERKQVTVLFADVKGSMQLAEAVDAEQWHRILDRFFQILADGVHRFEGTVNQYTGDGIMALFGAPIAHEDHAQRACYAALQLREALERHARELKREQGLAFIVRMGIHSGEVVVGKIGDDLRMDYTAQGQTVGLAARMQELASPGTCYLTGHTAELVSGYFELEDLGEFKIRGVGEPVPVAQLRGAGQLRTRFDLSRARGLTRFVGRGDDLQMLESALARAREGAGQVIGVVGEAGVGKSRLCFEFAERCRARGLQVLEGHALPHGKNIPFLPMLEVFRSYFGIAERDDDRSAREKIAGRLVLLDEAFREVLPLVFDTLGVPDPERPAPRMEPEARQRRLLAVVQRLMERGGTEGFAILIEDLHWLDPASEAFLAQWVEVVGGTRALLLLNFRPEYRAEWMSRPSYQQLPLRPLGAEAIRELLSDLLGDDPSVAGLADAVHARSAGNPFFTEEIVRSLVDAGSLEGSRGSYRLVAPIEALEVPGSVQAVLASRIDRLPERDKQLLQTAAVIGREFSEPILAAVAELPDPELAEALAALARAEFVHETALYPEAEYAFAHPLTHEVAIRSQLRERRRRIHAGVAKAIQEAFPEKLDERAALLAHHFEGAGETLEAARWHARAAAWVGTRDLAEALRHWQQVRELAAGLPETEESVGLRALACARILSTGGWRLGFSDREVDALYAEGRSLAERSGNPSLIGLIGAAYRVRLITWGRLREAISMGRELARLADESGDRERRATARVPESYAHYSAGRLAEALSLFEEGEAIAQGDLSLGIDLTGFSCLVWFALFRPMVLASMGRLPEAYRELARGTRLAREEGAPENLGWARGNLPVLAVFSGDLVHPELGDALASGREAVEIAESMGSEFSRASAYASLGAAHRARGEWAEARRCLETSLEISRSHRTGLELEAVNLASLAEVLLAEGEAEPARRTAEEAIALARERGQPHFEPQAQLVLARERCAAGGADALAASGAALDRARDLVEETGARVLEPQIVEARAELARALGDEPTRERQLREAHRLYTEAGATGHAARLARELGL